MQQRTLIVSGLCFLAAFLQAPSPVHAQDAARGDRPDLTLVSRIKLEAFDHSQVMDTLSYLTDVYGPRLTASPEFQQAADWAVGRLKSYGADDAKLEKWGTFWPQFGRSSNIPSRCWSRATPCWTQPLWLGPDTTQQYVN